MKHRLFVFATLCVLVLSFCPVMRAQDQGSIKQEMSPEEFHKAGLDKLSAEELANLDRWLRGDREKTAQAAAQTARAAAEKTSRTKMDLIVSRVAGRFAGLTGRTVIALEDGTVWKQVNSQDHIPGSPVDHPAAAVVHTTFGYKMRIEGAQEFYVNPVRK